MTINPTHLSHPKYRSDIDGLRAVAVLAVVAYHAFPNWIKGGFIGVDVFFVISGYLISTIIFQSLDRDAFSFTEFYSRRIRRIFPALILVLLACLALGWFALLPDEYKQLGKYIASGAGFVSNLALWRDAGYFDNSAESKPLLHLWSLGVEEQFYIIWPLVLWFAWKRKFNLLTITVLVAIISFVLNINGIKSNAIATFYSPQTRFWELLSGSILAWLTLYKSSANHSLWLKVDGWLISILYSDKPKSNGSTLANIISALGFMLLAYGFWQITKDLAFPGKFALIPVSASILIISAGPISWPNRYILSRKIAVWFGLISFPLYLWHWPILSFARIVEGEAPSVQIRLALIGLSIAISWLTYKVIETPIRLGNRNRLKTGILITLMALTGCLGYINYTRDGFGVRFNRLSSDDRLRFQKVANAWAFRGYPTPASLYIDPKFNLPRIGQNVKNIALFVGDSHSLQYHNSVGELFARNKSETNNLSSAIFLDGTWPPTVPQAIMDDRSVDKVIFSYYWALKYQSNRVHLSVRCCGGGKNGTFGGTEYFPPATDDHMDIDDKSLANLFTALKNNGKQVFIVLDNPFGEELDPHSLIYRGWDGFKSQAYVPLNKKVALERTEPIRARLIHVGQQTGAIVIDPFSYLCSKDYCPSFSIDGELLYKDYDHLSLYASKTHSSYIQNILMPKVQSVRH